MLDSPGRSTLLDSWSDILGPECWRLLDAEVAACPLTALTQLQHLVWIPVFDLQFILSHLPPSYCLLSIPNVFGLPSSFLHSSPSPHPSPITHLSGQSTRALIKNKRTTKNNSGGIASQRWVARQHVWAYTHVRLRIQSNHIIHYVCVGMPFHQHHFN